WQPFPVQRQTRDVLGHRGDAFGSSRQVRHPAGVFRLGIVPPGEHRRIDLAPYRAVLSRRDGLGERYVEVSQRSGPPFSEDGTDSEKGGPKKILRLAVYGKIVDSWRDFGAPRVPTRTGTSIAAARLS